MAGLGLNLRQVQAVRARAVHAASTQTECQDDLDERHMMSLSSDEDGTTGLGWRYDMLLPPSRWTVFRPVSRPCVKQKCGVAPLHVVSVENYMAYQASTTTAPMDHV